MNMSPCILPFTTAWPNELRPETGSPCVTMEDFLPEPLLEGVGGSREWELRI